MSRESFYLNQISNNIKDKEAKILVVGAGELDRKVFDFLKFNNVTFSNLNNTSEENINFYENMHDIKFNDNAFDYCVAHACIHHSSKPHNAILELYRVSAKGVLIIEANDSLTSRIACKLNLSEEYELSAVKKNKISGGVDNSSIPNYVYRWTEREIEKLLKSFKPEIKHKIYFSYSNHLKFTNSSLIKYFFYIYFTIFKKQQNLFSIFIDKKIDNIEYNNWYKA